MRCPDIRVTMARKVAPSPVVREKEDDVRPFGCREGHQRELAGQKDTSDHSGSPNPMARPIAGQIIYMTAFGLLAEVRDIGRPFGGTQLDRAEAQAGGLVAEIEADVDGLAVDGQGDAPFGGAGGDLEPDEVRG